MSSSTIGGGRRSDRGGPSRGRGGGAGSGRTSQPRGGRQGGSSRSRNNSRPSNTTHNGGDGRISNNSTGTTTSGMRDEDVLIAFMPFLKGNHSEAARIYESYCKANDQKTFVRSARDFLGRNQLQQQEQSTPPRQAAVVTTPPRTPIIEQQLSPATQPLATQPPPPSPVIVASASAPATSQDAIVNVSRDDMEPPELDNSLLHLQSGPTNKVSQLIESNANPSSYPSTIHSTGVRAVSASLEHIPTDDSINLNAVAHSLEALWRDSPEISLPPAPSVEIPVSLSAIWGTSIQPSSSNVHYETSLQPTDTHGSILPWNSSVPAQANNNPQQQPMLPPLPSQPEAPAVFTASELIQTTSQSAITTVDAVESTLKSNGHQSTRRDAPQAKRLWTRFEQQPGRIVVNGFSCEDSSLVLSLGPRDELTANWSLPLEYLSKATSAGSIDDALDGLMIGLFRRGCTDNGSSTSIISKAVIGFQYWRDPGSNSIFGKVPFYSPRTPGHVLFRMYWEKETIYTLATGPNLHVKVSENDFENSVRFILSNFKGKKSNPTSLSSLHSLAAVLETPVKRPNDSAARATWGCIQESRKVVEACWQEYNKTTTKLAELEATVEELKKQAEDEEIKSQELSVDIENDLVDAAEENGDTSASATLREKRRLLLNGKASSERKWRDSQLAFASILKAVVTNPFAPVFVRRDLIAKMRIEYELWCPLSEEFAIPNEAGSLWYEPLRDLSHTISADDFRYYSQARITMQMRTLGFDPNTLTLDDILFPRQRNMPSGQPVMDPGAVTVFNNVSAAMGQYFQQLCHNEDIAARQREMVRDRTEFCVRECGAFPVGTRVVIFGSSANGFGSPKSDLDMCLQLPEVTKVSDNDPTGALAMSKLAEYLEQTGMKEVDTTRLTARIPIIKYKCNGLNGDTEGDGMECDLSMHNPLAVLNTGYLFCYAEITPVTRVLASVIKRWAKARDLNDPSRHTLSSYGYIIMLLHFLTNHKRTEKGLIAPIAPPEGNPLFRNNSTPQPAPLLPNLIWMDPMWPALPKGTPYRELLQLPKRMLEHPFVEGKVVNTYYYRSSTIHEKNALRIHFPGQDLSLAILLASFFRYYAYEFDYKRHVVSLHSTPARGMVEREMKAEQDGWKHYAAALSIEDPFETFYDVAHVLRGGYYHRIRREFAVAYSKLGDAACNRMSGSWDKENLRSLSGSELLDWICEPITKEQDPDS